MRIRIELVDGEVTAVLAEDDGREALTYETVDFTGFVDPSLMYYTRDAEDCTVQCMFFEDNIRLVDRIPAITRHQ
jgi:hypothetical protein